MYLVVVLIIILIASIFLQINMATAAMEGFSESNKICCLYAYYEKDDKYKQNLQYFLDNGILDNVDYYFIINGNCTVEIPEHPNIKVLQRQNKGWDFGAWSYGVNHLNHVYDYYFFMNTSVCGPYTSSPNWTNPFLELFGNDVKVVGTSINIYPFYNLSNYNLSQIYNHNSPFPHVQSMFYCIDHEYFEYLRHIDFFNESEINNIQDFHELIIRKEIGLSQHAILNGWNINCILPKYRGLDYRTIRENINHSAPDGDPYSKNRYFGDSIDKYEVIFYKNNRE